MTAVRERSVEVIDDRIERQTEDESAGEASGNVLKGQLVKRSAGISLDVSMQYSAELIAWFAGHLFFSSSDFERYHYWKSNKCTYHNRHHREDPMKTRAECAPLPILEDGDVFDNIETWIVSTENIVYQSINSLPVSGYSLSRQLQFFINNRLETGRRRCTR